MPKKLLQRLTPSRDKFQGSGALRLLGSWINNHNLWHINRLSSARAFAVGLFCAMMPIPGQTFIAAFLAFHTKANLPLSVSLVFITNPFTMPVLFYAAYKLGAQTLQKEFQEVQFEISWQWLTTNLVGIWEPFLLGCLMMGIGLAATAYLLINAIWLCEVNYRWKKRQKNKQTETGK